MNIETIMKYKTFLVLGDTTNEEKYAYKIKKELLENNYNVITLNKNK